MARVQSPFPMARVKSNGSGNKMEKKCTFPMGRVKSNANGNKIEMNCPFPMTRVQNNPLLMACVKKNTPQMAHDKSNANICLHLIQNK